MKPTYITPEALEQFFVQAFQEDLGEADHSSMASVPATAEKKAFITMKSDGIIAGVTLAEWIFHRADPSLQIHTLQTDGTWVTHGEKIMEISGNARSILSAERIVLNCMQRMSGIATLTYQFAQKIAHTPCKLLDTRKTTPGFRIFEKWAVVIGGGHNHRMGLYDMVMLKDNHIDFAGGVKQALQATAGYLKKKQKNLPVEIETRNLHEVQEALETGLADFIMLDNMPTEEMTKAVALINGKAKTEASGNVDLHNIASIAACGVDYISVGALTHSAGILDISLKAL